jgi:hypothetical protein
MITKKKVNFCTQNEKTKKIGLTQKARRAVDPIFLCALLFSVLTYIDFNTTKKKLDRRSNSQSKLVNPTTCFVLLFIGQATI